MGPVLLSTPIIAPTNLDRHQILRNFCHESGRKGLKDHCRRRIPPAIPSFCAPPACGTWPFQILTWGSAGFPVGPCTVLEMDFQVTVCQS